MDMNLGVFLAALSGASVEFFETAAIGYAIARSGYKREAIWGTLAGLSLVGLLSSFFGVGLRLIPIHLLQIAIGIVLLWFGWGWYRKSILRQAKGHRAGWIDDNPLAAQGIQLERQPQGFSKLNFAIMFKSAALEALEVAIVVVTLGLASGAWNEAIFGMGVALFLTLAVVSILHGYLQSVPDVLLKLGAGVLLLAYGTFWLGEGLSFDWPYGDVAILALAGLYSLAAVLAIRRLRIS